MTSGRLGAMLAVAILAGACGSTIQGTGHVASRCAPVFFGVPGSGQGALNPAPTIAPDGVSLDDALRFGTTVALLKSELVAIAGKALASTAAIEYPAIPVARYIGPGGLTADLDTSEAQGVVVLVNAIHTSYAGGCDNRPVLLSGYSQGAEVVVQAVDRLSASEQAAVSVALFGNPSYEPGVAGDFPGTAAAAGIRPTFRAGVAFSLSADVRRRTIDICAPGDPVCGVDPTATTLLGRIASVLGHVKIHENAYAFGTDGFTQRAAQFLWDHRAG